MKEFSTFSFSMPQFNFEQKGDFNKQVNDWFTMENLTTCSQRILSPSEVELQYVNEDVISG